MLNKSLYQSDKLDWETPIELFTELDNEFKFTLDACALPENAKCKNYYTPLENGLLQPWTGNVWLNPPYGRDIKNWISRAKNQSEINIATVVCLVPCRTDARWWHQNVMKSSEIRLLTRRLTFSGANNKAPFAAAIVIFRPGFDTPILSQQKI